MTHDERVWYHTYVTNEGIAEHAERIVALEELCQEMLPYVGDSCPEECRYRDECMDERNLGPAGLPLRCVAYDHIGEKISKLGMEVC